MQRMRPRGPAGPDWLPEDLAHEADEHVLGKGARLFRMGEAPVRFHFVLAGELAAIRYLPDGGEAVMLMAHPGEFFAEASLFVPAYTCEARALTACRLLSWPTQAFREAIARHPEAAMAFTRTLAINLRRQCSRVERLRLKRASERVLHYLTCEAGPDGWCVLPGTQQEWAAELALEPETLYRVLARLERARRIERDIGQDKRRIRLLGFQGSKCGL